MSEQVPDALSAHLISWLEGEGSVPKTVERLNAVRELISTVSPFRDEPVDSVSWVPAEGRHHMCAGAYSGTECHCQCHGDSRKLSQTVAKVGAQQNSAAGGMLEASRTPAASTLDERAAQ